jgi:hypothetical protein
VPLTFKQAKDILAKYNGRGGSCVDAPDVPDFVLKTLQHMLFSGQNGNLRTFSFCAQRGCLTLPYELETPLKVRIGDRVGSVWDKWYDYHSSKEMTDCYPADRALIEDPNYYPTVYDIPFTNGANIGVIGVCEESPDSHVIVQGLDATGREIVSTNYKGEQIVGEYIRIKKGVITYTNFAFAKITGIVKSETNGYVQLLWVSPSRNLKGFLADYSPLETAPSYRRFRLTSPYCTTDVKVSILGRIRLRTKYTDNDYIPFDNMYAIDLAGREINSNANVQPDLAKSYNEQLVNSINMENEYKRVQNGQPMEVYIPLSGGAIRNIV